MLNSRYCVHENGTDNLKTVRELSESLLAADVNSYNNPFLKIKNIKRRYKAMRCK